MVPSKKGVLGLYFWQSDVDFVTNVLFGPDGLIISVFVVLDVDVFYCVVTLLEPVDVVYVEVEPKIPLTEPSTVLV